MVNRAIKALNEKRGSCRANIVKYIMRIYKPIETPPMVDQSVKLTLKEGVQKGVYKQRSGTGARGFFMLAKKQPKKQRNKKK